MVNAFTEDGKTALHIAAECNNLKVAQLLCQAGAGEYIEICCSIGINSVKVFCSL